MNYIITTEQLTKKYKSFVAVNDVSLHIRKGSIYGFLGPNGAGKSTTMKMLLGLTAPTKGDFTIDGKQFPADRISILKEIGSFIESPSFYANLMTFDGYYEKKWFPYTMPISDIYGLRAAFNLIAGDKTLYERHARIGSATRAAVKEAGLKLHLQSGYSNTVTVFDIPECTDAKSILDEMRTKYNIMLAGSFDELSGKVIRIGHMGENARLEHMVPALEALSATLTDLGVTLQGNLADLFLKHYREFQD